MGLFLPSTAFHIALHHRELGLVPSLDGPEQLHGPNFRPPSKLYLGCNIEPCNAIHHRELALVTPLDGPEQLHGPNLRSPMTLVGPITIAPMQIMFSRHPMRLFLYGGGGGGGDSPLLYLLGFAAGKNCQTHEKNDKIMGTNLHCFLWSSEVVGAQISECLQVQLNE